MKKHISLSAAAVLAWVLAIPVNLIVLSLLFRRMESGLNWLIEAGIQSLPPEQSDDARAALLFYGFFYMLILALWIVWAVLHLVAAGKTFMKGRCFSLPSLLPNRRERPGLFIRKSICLLFAVLFLGYGIFRLVSGLGFGGIGWGALASAATLYYEWCFCAVPEKAAPFSPAGSMDSENRA